MFDRLTFALALLGITGCGSATTAPADTGRPEAGAPDAGPDARAEASAPDAGPDARAEARGGGRRPSRRRRRVDLSRPPLRRGLAGRLVRRPRAPLLGPVHPRRRGRPSRHLGHRPAPVPGGLRPLHPIERRRPLRGARRPVHRLPPGDAHPRAAVHLPRRRPRALALPPLPGPRSRRTTRAGDDRSRRRAVDDQRVQIPARPLRPGARLLPAPVLIVTISC
jgi:hypothetical protein